MADAANGDTLREHALLLRALGRAQRLCTEQQARLLRAEAQLIRARAIAIVRTTEAQWARERTPLPEAAPQRNGRIRAMIAACSAVPWS